MNRAWRWLKHRVACLLFRGRVKELSTDAVQGVLKEVAEERKRDRGERVEEAERFRRHRMQLEQGRRARK